MAGKFEQGSTPKRKRGRKRWLIPAVIIFLIALFAVLFFVLRQNNTDAGIPVGKASVAEATNGELKTPVGTLVFPEAWADRIWTEDTSSGSQYSEQFYGNVGKDKVVLFELSIGPDGTGYQLGYAPDENGTLQEIWLNIHEIESKNSWTEKQISQINVMQGCVNDLIEQIRTLDGFQENG